MLRFYRLIASSTPIYFQRAKSIRFHPLCPSLRYLFSFSTSREEESDNVVISPNIFQGALKLSKTLPSHTQIQLKPIFDKYKEANDLSQLDEGEIMTMITLLSRIGNGYYKQGDVENALLYFLEISQIASRNLVRYDSQFIANNIQVAEIYFQTGLLDKAEEFINKAEDVQHSNIENDDNLQQLIMNRMVLSARIHYAKKEWDEALEGFNAVLESAEKFSDDRRWISGLSEIYMYLGNTYRIKNQFRQAIKVYRDGLAKEAKSSSEKDGSILDLRLELARALFYAERYEEALKTAQAVYDIDVAYNRRGDIVPFRSLFIIYDVHFARERYADCLEVCQIVIDTLDKCPPVYKEQYASTYLTMTLCYIHLKNSEATKKYFDMTERQIHDCYGPQAPFHLANFYYLYADAIKEVQSQTEDKLKEAKDFCTKANQLFSELKEFELETNTLFCLGFLSHLQQNLKESDNYINEGFKKIHELNSTRQTEKAYQLVGNFFRKQRKYDESIHHLNKAIETCQNNHNKTGLLHTHYFSLGQVYDEIGELEKAEEAYRDAIKASTEQVEEDDPSFVKCIQALVETLKEAR